RGGRGQHAVDGVRHAERAAEPGLEAGQFAGRRQLTVPQQVDYLFETCLVGELTDVVAAVDQLTFGPVDMADRAGVDVDTVQPAVYHLFHLSSGSRRGHAVRLADERRVSQSTER